MSYLDDPRVFFAAERTLLAWQRTAIALIGLGFVVERFGLFVRMVAAGAPLPPGHAHTSLLLGILFVLLGGVIASLAAFQFRRFIHTLSEPEIPRGHAVWFGPFINHTLAVAALAMATWFIVSG
ncbi:MAG: DUF202 domain-containing protein [Burkholderiaceae bacterium]|nr:DUF202 domain-containing protein [Burkholderiaceae bacterium]